MRDSVMQRDHGPTGKLFGLPALCASTLLVCAAACADKAETTRGAASPASEAAAPVGAAAPQTPGPATAGRAASAAASSTVMNGRAGSGQSPAGTAGRTAPPSVSGATSVAGASAASSANVASTAGATGSAGAAQGGADTQPGSAGAGGVAPVAGSSTTPSAADRVWSECRFHFGAIADVVRNDPLTVKELDFFTTGWMGLKDTFDMDYVCKDTAPGATFEGKLPVIVSYVAAFYAKRNGNLKDCNAPGAQQDLCTAGAAVIQRDLSKILRVYENYAQGFAACYGTTRPIVFEMEPDFFQYTISNQQQPWTPTQAGQIMSQFVGALKKHLPNARFSLDISPWVPPDNGSDGGKQWFSNFDMTLFTFVNTSGGHTDGGNAQIRQDNKMTWSGVNMASGKPVLADTGYGVNGRSEGPDSVWNDPNNINARIRDGVVSISQYNPAQGWGNEIAAMRSKLSKPTACP